MEGADGKDWPEDTHEECAPSNDQTRSTMAQNAFALAGFHTRDADESAAEADGAAKHACTEMSAPEQEQARGDATAAVNWLGTTVYQAGGLANMLRGAVAGREDCAVGAVGLPSGNGESVHTPEAEDDGGQAEVDLFMQRFLRESRRARVHGSAERERMAGQSGHATAELEAKAAAAARMVAGDRSAANSDDADAVHGGGGVVDRSERGRVKSELVSMEMTLRFLELDLVTLIERSRDGMG